MKIFYICIAFLLTFNAYSSAWYENKDQELKLLTDDFNSQCNINFGFNNYYPFSMARLITDLDSIIDNEKCKILASKIKSKIEDNFFRKDLIMGYQSQPGNYYFQDLGNRYYDQDNIYISSSGIKNNYAYKLKLLKNIDSGKTIFDESYISYKYKNTIIKAGRIERWWSPSSETSLIYSNASRPQKSISLENYDPINLNLPLIKLLGNLDYEIFLNRLDDDRHIKKTLIFGNRFTFYVNNELSLSLLRLAQFGGKGRPRNTDTIIDMILGKDTTNSSLSINEQAGNQIAGIDLVYVPLKYKNKIRFYGQYVGEDGLDPIIDDGWIGAIFPSKRFWQAGINLNINLINRPTKITFERATTDSGYTNVTYNHSIYKTGLRHENKPIGANIDADSDRNIFKIETKLNTIVASLKFSENHINKNDNQFNTISLNDIRFNMYEFSLIKYYDKQKIKLDINFNFLDNKSLKEGNKIFLRIEKKLV